MRWRRLLVVGLTASVGALAFLRRRSARAVRVDVYREDGSMVSLERGDPQAERMLAFAGAAIRAARGLP